MEFRKDKNVAARVSMIEGAIFMSNRKTKKECLSRKLFGLPYSQASIVKQLKSGMVLFLFEYEERKLYGVFEAASDGALNIEPNAFNKISGKPFSAQIRFQRIWHCHPLSEPEFSAAIKYNYYTTQKFHLHLSQEQVFNLLLLFSAKRMSVERPRVLIAGNNVQEQSQEHARDKSRTTITSNSADIEFSMDDVAQTANFSRHPPDIFYLDLKIQDRCGQDVKSMLNREDSTVKQSLYLPTSFSNERSRANLTPSMSHGDGVMGDLHINRVQDHHFYRADNSFLHAGQSSHVHGIDGFSWGSKNIVLPSSRIDLPIRRYSRHESLGIPTNKSGHRASSILDHCESSSSSIHSLGTGFLEDWSIDSKNADYIELPYIDGHEISGDTVPFAGGRYFERRSMNSRDEYGSHGDVSLRNHSEPCRSTVPLLQAASFSEKSTCCPSFMCRPSKNPLELGDQDQSPAFYQNEEGCVRPINGCYEALKTASCLSGDGFASSTAPTQISDGPGKDLPNVREYNRGLKSDGYGETGHHSLTRDNEYCSLQSGLYSDHYENRPSVFSRLSTGVASSFQHVGRNESDAVISVGGICRILSQRREEWRKSVKYCRPSNRRIREGQTNLELAKSEQINEEDLLVYDDTSEGSSVSLRGPFLNFKRRSQVRQMHEGEGWHVEANKNEESSSGRKRRKLIRPPLVAGEHFDKAITDVKEIETPVDNDRKDESRVSPEDSRNSAIYTNNNRDGNGKLASLRSHVHCNTTEQSKVPSDLLESAKVTEKSASSPLLELQTNQSSSVNGEQHVGCLSEVNGELPKPADFANLVKATSNDNGISKMTIIKEPSIIENTDGKEHEEGFMERTGIENAEQKSESLEEGHQLIEADSEKNDVPKMMINDKPAMLENYCQQK